MGNWFYQRLFQSITGSPHHQYTSQACSPLSIHITSEADWTKSGTGRFWLPAPPRKNPAKVPELDTHTHSVIYWSILLYPFQSSGHPKFYPSVGHELSACISTKPSLRFSITLLLPSFLWLLHTTLRFSGLEWSVLHGWKLLCIAKCNSKIKIQFTWCKLIMPQLARLLAGSMNHAGKPNLWSEVIP
jgi:hypothetical protein